MTALNPEQRRAVAHTGGPLLVLAGAGSGKTRVIVHRIARLVGDGVDPAAILAVTFTNRAAREMRERAEALAGAAAARLNVTTFHALGARLLREHPARFGLARAFSIYDEDDTALLMRATLDELGVDSDRPAVRRHLAAVEAGKNRGDRLATVIASLRGPEGEEITRVLTAYDAALRRANACDFADLIARVVWAMEDDPGYRDALRRRFTHLLVDEFQDTNDAQFRWLKLLTSADVVAVGDDDQAIYGWRGASVANMRRFLDELPGATSIALEQNYRSGQLILDAAHAIVEPLPGRLPKRLVATRTQATPIDGFVGADDRDEAAFVAREIAALQAQGVSPGDVGVLFRTNAQSRALEDALRSQGLAHDVVGSTAWFDRREIRDVAAYLRLAANPRDTVAFARIANVPTRGVGPSTVRAVCTLDPSVSLGDASRRLAETMRPSHRARAGLVGLAGLLAALGQRAAVGTAADVVAMLLSETDLEGHLLRADPVGGADRVENVREFARLAASDSSEDTSVAAFLERLALDGALESTPAGEGVQLMTVHAAKGLEFRVVFVTGLEDGQFPLERGAPDGDTAEERRLCYVAFTRAQDRLYVTAARRRRGFGTTRDARPSAFLAELPPHTHRVRAESTAVSLVWDRGRVAPRSVRPWDEYDQRPLGERVPEQGITFDGSELGPPARAGGGEHPLIGAAVTHRLFGVGTVLAAEGEDARAVLTIEFPAAGSKRVRRPYVEPMRGPARGPVR